MNNKLGGLGEMLLEQGLGIKKTSKQQTVPQQVQPAQTNTVSQPVSPEDLTNALYGSSAAPQITQGEDFSQAVLPGSEEIADLEKKQLEEVRKSLHKQRHDEVYYNDLINPPKQKELDTAERLEQEKQEEEAKKMEELQEEQKKNEKPMAVLMAQNTEKHRGSAG